LPQLDLTTYTSQLFWLSLTFLCLWFLMRYVLLEPLQRVLLERKNRVLGLVNEARDLQRAAQDMRDVQLRKLNQAKTSHRQKVEQSVAQAHEAIAKTAELLTQTYRTKHKQVLQDAANQYSVKRPLIEELSRQAAQKFLKDHLRFTDRE
jgi:F-type H+-transporting ATPase subunit b